ncbi:MAG: adenylosuccinate synthase [Deltaproteobacteria bacterium]|nr:adenylosuccinate synthase [Deltaproteobacteria bacterium]
MSTVIVVGVQWGDEGKGKIVDILARDADIIVRFGGGNNAGHTLLVGEERTVLHLIPSGVLHQGKICVIANGVVVDPEVLVSELTALRARGYLTDDACLKISDEAHLIMPYHKAIDLARERLRGKGEIGTTGRGIGPTYEDKMARTGIRFVDLLEEGTFREKLERNLEEKNIYLRSILKEPGMEFAAIYDAYRRHGDLLRRYVSDTALYLQEGIDAGRRILFEGAQGTMLDVDHGTYPYVTSSNTVSGAVCAGAGVGPGSFQSVVGICKAYTTRVGNGPFPTEERGPIGERLRESGDEFGATTGRPRRCGWFDAVLVRQAARLNGLTGIALTKLDVLTGMDPLRICTGYRAGGQRFARVPASTRVLEAVVPEYEEMPGWTTPLSAARTLAELPVNARRYVARLEELTATPITMISVGAEREETILI